MKSILIALFTILMSISVMAQDRILVGVDYARANFKPNFADPVSEANAVAVHGLVRVVGPAKDGFKLRVGAEVRKTFNVEVFSDYMNAEGMMVDIYRDPYTYYGVGELAYKIKFVELSARAKLGAEKLHENLTYDFTRAYEFRGTLVDKHFGFTPVIIGFKKDPQGFHQYFGAGAHLRF